jgi:hypothetical protein
MGVTYEVDPETSGKLVEVLTEKICFRISEDFTSEYALALLSAIQCYMYDCKNKTRSWNIIHKTNRRHALHLMIVSSNIYMRSFLITWLRKDKEFYETIYERPNLLTGTISEIDYYVNITPERVAHVTATGKLHFHQGVGILLGCDSKSLPNLFAEDAPQESGLLVISSNCLHLFPESEWENLLGDKFKSVITIDSDVEANMHPDVISVILKAECVIGMRGFVTYAGSSLKKPVLEFVNPADTFWYLTQWSNPSYVPLILYPNIDVKDGISRLWNTVVECRKNLTSIRPKEDIISVDEV